MSANSGGANPGGEFAGQVALVTGGAQGLGLAIATLLFERGASLCLLDIDEPRLQESAAALGDSDRVLPLVTDVTDEAAILAARAAIMARFGRVDVLVNNTGTYPPGNVRDITVAEWDRVFDINAKSMFLTTRSFMDIMAAQRYGRIVCIVTTDATKAKPTTPHYAAAKAAVANLIKTFAFELGPEQVLVNGVSPGAIATERAKSEPWLKERIKEIPLGRPAEPKDIAEVVAFLASPRNRFVTGETVIASGGATMV